MGPVVIISSIKPFRLSGMNDSLLGLRGDLKTAQHLVNSNVNQFLFVTRPNEAFYGCEVSEKQRRKIDFDVRRKLSNSKNIQQIFLTKSDQIIKERKQKTER